MLEIELIPLLKDNYAYFLREPTTGLCAVVDPSEARPVLAFLERKKAKLGYILNTHHHADHTGGNEELVRATGAQVVGPRADEARIPSIGHPVCEREPFWLGKAEAGILEIPGHTTGHIAFWFPDSKAVFCGDTLFAMGCGRMFEGTPGQMWESLQKLAHLPKETRVYCGHEYTEANAAFAVTIDGGNEKLVARRERVRAARAEGRPTIPSTIGEELETNPFLRAGDPAIRGALGLETSGPVKVFAEIRRRKDGFK